MKKRLSISLCLCFAILLAVPALASGTPAASEPELRILVGPDRQALNLPPLPRQPCREGGAWMLPLRVIAEALGDSVGWDAKTGAITVDDGAIQKATLFSGTADVTFASHLKGIDLSRTVTNAAATVIHDGCTYVPLSFFEEFWNDAQEENGVFTITPSTCALTAA